MDKNEEIIKLLKEYNQEHIIELLNKLDENKTAEGISRTIYNFLIEQNIAKKIKLYIPEAIVLDPFKASESKRHGKVGIAYRSIEDLKKALINYPYDDKEKESITREELVELGLMGNKNLRIKIATRYNISSSSLNAIFEGLNMLNVTIKELKGTIENE